MIFKAREDMIFKDGEDMILRESELAAHMKREKVANAVDAEGRVGKRKLERRRSMGMDETQKRYRPVRAEQGWCQSQQVPQSTFLPQSYFSDE